MILPNCLIASPAGMFADDTSLTTNGTSINDVKLNLNKDLENVQYISGCYQTN